MEKIVVILISLIGVLLVAIGLYDYLLDIGPNNCEMTYMFEYPKYTKIKLPPKIVKSFPQYGLYAYSEGSYTNKVIQNDFSGVPVLFIPGNGGSYRQVRSLASVSLRKSEDLVDRNIWFDYFSIDFNEELSGLMGSLMEIQTVYTTLMIDQIFSLYKDERKMIIVGHSMGGIVGRAVLSRGYEDKIDIIYTQATPHQAPVMPIDRDIVTFYHDLVEKEKHLKIFKTPIVSVSGGRRDIIVPNYLTDLTGLNVARGSFSASTTGIPQVWASTDHLCVVWCKQLVLATVRSMFELIDPAKKNQLLQNPVQKSEVLFKHFLSPSPKPHFVQFNDKIKPEELSLPYWRFRSKKLTASSKKRTFVLPLKNALKYGEVITIITNIKDHAFLSVCSEQLTEKDSQCTTVSDINPVFLPRDMKVISINISNHSGNEILIVQTPKFSKSEKYSHHEITLSFTNKYSSNVHDPSFFTMESSPNLLGKETNVQHIEMPSLMQFFRAYELVIYPINPQDCQYKTKSGYVYARLWVPWANDEIYHVFNCAEEGRMILSLSSPRLAKHRDKRPVLSLFDTSGVTYDVRIQYSFKRSLGQYFRFNSISLIFNAYASLWIIYFSMSFIEQDGSWVTRWACVIGSTVIAAMCKLYLSLMVDVSFIEYGDSDYSKVPFDAVYLHSIGLWPVMTPFLSLLITVSGAIFVIVLFDRITNLFKKLVSSLVKLMTVRPAIGQLLYTVWSLIFIFSPVFNVSFTHFICFLWMIHLKESQSTLLFSLDTILILARLFILGLNVPTLIVFINNMKETAFSLNYFTSVIIQNLQTQNTCMGILQWSVLHINPIGTKLSQSSDAVKILVFTFFSIFFFVTDHSLYRCCYFDLSMWILLSLCAFLQCISYRNVRKKDE